MFVVDVTIVVMILFLGISFFLLGSIIGSFLNVLLLRKGANRSLGGRSGCMVCRTGLLWWQLIPIGSFLFLQGKCYLCKSSISKQYPIVEIMTGLAFVIIFLMNFSLMQTIILLFASILSILMFVYDMKHMIIPNEFVYSFIALSFLWVILFSETSLLVTLLGGLVAMLPLLLIFIFSKGRAMGLGDIKLMLGMGLFTGLLGGLAILYIAFVLGAVVGLFLIFINPYIRHLVRKIIGRGVTLSSVRIVKKGLRQQIPFGPFLIIGFWIVFISGIDITYFLFL